MEVTSDVLYAQPNPAAWEKGYQIAYAVTVASTLELQQHVTSPPFFFLLLSKPRFQYVV